MMRLFRPQAVPCVLSVITPTYNRADFLKETIDSVLMQEFSALQYIVMDDGSSDDTATLMRRYRRRIEYHWHENVGEQRTVNRALQGIRGEYFMIVNSDDPLLPGSLERMVRTLRDDPGLLAAYPDWQVIDPDSKPITTIRVGKYDSAAMLATTSVPIGPGACFRSSILETVGFRNTLLRYSADLDYWHRIALAGRIAHVPETLATHRVHPGSASVSDRGGRLAREVAYLFEVYGRHPCAPRRGARRADSRGQFVAAFSETDWKQAVRALLRSFLIQPIAFLACLTGHGLDTTRDFVASLGAPPAKAPNTALQLIHSASTRLGDYPRILRATLHDPLGMLDAMAEYGLARLAADIRHIPLHGQPVEPAIVPRTAV